MAISDNLRSSILDKVFRGEDFPSPTGIFVSVHSSDPGRTGAGEIAGAERQPVEMAPASEGTTVSTVAVKITMPAATVTHVGLWDAQEGGTFLWGGPAEEVKSYDEGDILSIPAGELSVSLD